MLESIKHWAYLNMTAESYSTANANGLRSPDGRPMQQFLVDTRHSARKKLLALSLEQKVRY